MSKPVLLAQQISLFRNRIQNRNFDGVTVRILESIIVSRDGEILTGAVFALKQFMRDESILIFREIAEESVEIKLLCTDFLIRVFAKIGDVESCLALRYEALVMRDQMATTYPELQVTCKEWMTFIEHSLENGFHSVANQACEKALMFYKANHVALLKVDNLFHDVCAINEMKRLKDIAIITISLKSVQAQVATYLKQKNVEQRTPNLATFIEAQSSGSSMFRSGIRKHNLRRFRYYQCLGHLS